MSYTPALFKQENRPSPFSEEIPSLQLLWDSTSLGWLKRCPRYYQLRMLEGLETKKGSIHLTFGILYHAALETYDTLRTRGENHRSAQDAAVKYALENSVEHYEAWQCPNCERIWPSDEDHTFCLACRDDHPGVTFSYWRDLLTGLPQKGRLQLVRTVVWYTEQYKHDALETVTLQNGEAAVELSFTLPLDMQASTGEIFALRGHLDRLAQADEGIWIPDRKTTKSTLYPSYFDGFSPHNQVTLYTLASRMLFDVPAQGVIIDAAQVAVGFSRFQRGYIHRTVSQLEEWLNDLNMWMKQAEQYATLEHYPQNEEACNLYGGCPFREICGRSPEVRQKYIDNDYVRRPWNPAEDR